MEKMDTNFKNLNLHDIETDWTKASQIIKETADKEIGFLLKLYNTTYQHLQIRNKNYLGT